MVLNKLLIANRGEIAIRIVRTAAEMGIRTVTIHSEDDADSLHTRKSDETRGLRGIGPVAYLDAEQIISVAREAKCDAIHPGYGFLSENARFARRCAEEGLLFIGPSPETLDLFGDKARTRALAEAHGIPILPGTSEPTSFSQAREFLRTMGPKGAMMIKAIAGGGGRGMRPVRSLEELESAYERCRSEAQQAFGNGDVYVEQLFPFARHIEVQILGDGAGAVSHLGERECSLQRQRQKLIEMAPAPGLRPAIRDRLFDAALRMAEAASFSNIGTFEFLVDAGADRDDAPMAFIEANPRLQVEHTVTEEVTGIDLVRVQLELASGRSLSDLGLQKEALPKPRGLAMQLRINMETMNADGSARPAGGVLAAFEAPSGPGTRVDTFGYVGYRTNPRYDSLLAKLIVHTSSNLLADAAAKAYRALCEFKVKGAQTNIPFLQTLLQNEEFLAGHGHTRFIEEHIATLLSAEDENHQRLYFEPATTPAPNGVGARIDSKDPLAILIHGKIDSRISTASAMQNSLPELAYNDIAGPEGTVPISAPMQGTIVSITVSEGEPVQVGQQVLVMEAMKMEHVITSEVNGYLRSVNVARGDTVLEGYPLAFIEEAEVEGAAVEVEREIDLDEIRPDLAEVMERHAVTLDAARPEAVARRRKTGQRTARENIEDLCDPDSFTEYGALVYAARRQRNTIEELIRKTPADGLVMGLGRVNGDLFPDTDSRCVAMSYDYTVLAGTQGKKNHQKKDRMFEIAEKWRLPILIFTEGGGGRPGDTDQVFAANLHTNAFHLFGKLSGLVPLVGINSGRCFAGNAVILGCCDVIIATENSSIGMGGPAMIEGGGLGVFHPDEVGPMSVQIPSGVVDIAVKDEAEAVQAAKKYLSYFQGTISDWDCADQRLLRRTIPENRLRVYDVRSVIQTLADNDSILELRKGFGPGMITAFLRIEGRPMGVIANNPMVLGGAIDSAAADKAARFMQLCDAFDIPLLFLCDTPGNMVGPEEEKTALVRHCCRLFVTGSNLTVPFFTVVLRKAYGLGAQGMAGGGFHAPFFAVSWPTGEFGGMSLEGAVKLGYRNELAAIEDPAERKAKYDQMVAEMYEKGKALNAAALLEIDEVIDPAATRTWIMAGLRSVPESPPRTGKKHAWVDTW